MINEICDLFDSLTIFVSKLVHFIMFLLVYLF